MLPLGDHQRSKLVGQRDELGRLGHEVGLAAQVDHGGHVALAHDGNRPLGGFAIGPLGRTGQTVDAEPLGRLADVAAVLLQGPLGVEHPDAGRLPEGLDVLGGEGHDQASAAMATGASAAGGSPTGAEPPGAWSADAAVGSDPGSGSGPDEVAGSVGGPDEAADSVAGGVAGEGAGAPGEGAPGEGAATGRDRWGAEPEGGASGVSLGLGGGRCWATQRPSATASATTRHIRVPERMASSFPGITYSITSGSQFVSTTATTGIPSLLASVTAMCSFFVSMTKMASGSLSRPLIPPRFRLSFSSSRTWRSASFLGIASKSPAACIARSSCMRLTREDTVAKLVSIPPSQRWFTKGIPQASAYSDTGPWVCFFVPTNRTVPPPATRSRMKL